MELNLRRSIIIGLLALLVVITVAASPNYGFHWGVALIAVFFWLLCDFMFLSEDDFVFEINYRKYQAKLNAKKY